VFQLKFLYVAITRSVIRTCAGDPSHTLILVRARTFGSLIARLKVNRSRCEAWWHGYECEVYSRQTLWSSQDLIRICTPGMEVPRLAVSSTVEEWEKSGNADLLTRGAFAQLCLRPGRTLFRSKRYLQAMHCFDRAGLPREMAVAEAYLHRENARTLTGGTKQLEGERARAFVVAADEFVRCAQEAVNEKQAYYRAAGECYAQANQHKAAGKAFLDATEYTLSARHYRKVSTGL
jgi:tetratricopeptide (TPR) repeat protein